MMHFNYKVLLFAKLIYNKSMNMTFEDILTSLLESYENNPEQNVESFIESKCKEFNLTDEQVKIIKKANEYLDGFAAMGESLSEARAEGKSRKRWVLETVDAVAEDRNEGEKASLVSAISDTLDKVIEESSTKE